MQLGQRFFLLRLKPPLNARSAIRSRVALDGIGRLSALRCTRCCTFPRRSVVSYRSRYLSCTSSLPSDRADRFRPASYSSVRTYERPNGREDSRIDADSGRFLKLGPSGTLGSSRPRTTVVDYPQLVPAVLACTRVRSIALDYSQLSPGTLECSRLPSGVLDCGRLRSTTSRPGSRLRRFVLGGRRGAESVSPRSGRTSRGTF